MEISRPATSQSNVPVYSNIHGRIGDNPANLSLSQQQDRVDIFGSVGNRQVNIHEYMRNGSGSINGYVWGGGKNDNVSIWVSDFGGGKSLSGYIGNDNVNVQERQFGNQIQITGWVGRRWVNVYGTQFSSNNVDFRGNVGNEGNSTIGLSAFHNPAGAEVHYEGLIPALIYTKRD